MLMLSSPGWPSTLRDLGLINTYVSMMKFLSEGKNALELKSTTNEEDGNGDTGTFILSNSLTANFELSMKLLADLLRTKESLKVFREKSTKLWEKMFSVPSLVKGTSILLRVNSALTEEYCGVK